MSEGKREEGDEEVDEEMHVYICFVVRGGRYDGWVEVLVFESRNV